MYTGIRGGRLLLCWLCLFASLWNIQIFCFDFCCCILNTIYNVYVVSTHPFNKCESIGERELRGRGRIENRSLAEFMDWEMLREKICAILRAGFPLDEEFAEADSVTNPMIAHGDGFGFLGGESIVGDPFCTAIVCDDDGGFLGVTYGSEVGPNPGSSAASNVESGVFGLADALTNSRDLATDGQDGAVNGNGVAYVARSEPAAGDGN